MWARHGAAPPDCPEDRTNGQTDTDNPGQIIRRRKGQIVDAEGEKSRRERALGKKMLKDDDQSHYVYENKQKT